MRSCIVVIVYCFFTFVKIYGRAVDIGIISFRIDVLFCFSPMNRFFAMILVFAACTFVFPTAFAQTTTTQTNPNLRLNNLQLVAPEKLKTIDATGIKENPKKDVEEQKPVPLRIPWETIAIVVSICSGLAAVMGFSVSSHKKKRAISKYMEEIDATFSEYKCKSKLCEADLYRLRDLLEERLKKGKIDESLYELLTKRIDKYLREIQELPAGS